MQRAAGSSSTDDEPPPLPSVPPPPLDSNPTSPSDDSDQFPTPPSTAPVTTSSPQGGDIIGKDGVLRRRMEFLGLKPEESEEYKKIREGNKTYRIHKVTVTRNFLLPYLCSCFAAICGASTEILISVS